MIERVISLLLYDVACSQIKIANELNAQAHIGLLIITG